ncbi:MAG: hypothetical protein ACREQE_09205 [Candidatus Binataceae bacterium]
MDADKQALAQNLAIREAQIAALAAERHAEYAFSRQQRLYDRAVKDLRAREALVMRLSERTASSIQTIERRAWPRELTEDTCRNLLWLHSRFQETALNPDRKLGWWPSLTAITMQCVVLFLYERTLQAGLLIRTRPVLTFGSVVVFTLAAIMIFVRLA